MGTIALITICGTNADIFDTAPTNGSTWAFGGVPMGSAGTAGTAGMPAQRGNNMATFAQSLGGGASQPSTPLDLS